MFKRSFSIVHTQRMPPQDVVGQNHVATDSEEKILKNKPKASKLRQQQLPAWQPILTASTVIPTVIGIGVVFIPIGVALFLASDSVKEYTVDYTSCTIGQQCHLRINITDEMKGDVYIYYYLENYFQNHRRYVKSRNDKQLLGNVKEVADCEPFAYDENKRPIAPCGAIANSKFNDTYALYRLGAGGEQLEVPLTKNGVLWDVDKDRKFKNPAIPPGGNLCNAFEGTAKPPYWQKHPCEDDGFENVDLIVWMRTAALPNFRKLWRIVDRNAETPANPGLFRNGLPAGEYTIVANSNYPVTVFGGRKSIVLSTTSWAGGKNSFLGIAYLVVGSLAIVLGIIFIIIHIKFGHSISELSDVGATH
ncbi:unnamed protein product [Cylicocyclus nassatus]|uniref:Cell cycle control protein 50A n=1 Tax=Cylicocyclus nassatus TaxID=53992 RepID=A0AA36M9G8_CYLNA|nr:unnamed protein product [Cylicocyclus nassatus]